MTAICPLLDASNSNWEASDGYSASDPGPVYVRADLVRLMADLLGADVTDRRVLMGFVTFGTAVSVQADLADIGNPAARDALVDAVGRSLQPQGWMPSTRTDGRRRRPDSVHRRPTERDGVGDGTQRSGQPPETTSCGGR